MARTVIVTGATGGIGEACVETLAAGGWRTIASGRNPERLAALSKRTGCEALLLNLSDAAATLAPLSSVAPDAVVHCAGILGPAGKVYELSPEDVSGVIAANIVATMNLLRAVVPPMVARGDGHIVLVGSVAGGHAGTSPALYAATKAAVSALARDLRFDLHGSGVRVTELRPGRVMTGIHAQLGTSVDLYTGYRCLEAGDIASAVSFALTAPPHVDVTSMDIMPADQILGGSHFHRSSER